MEINLPNANSVEGAEYNLSKLDVEDCNVSASLNESPECPDSNKEAPASPCKSSDSVICPDGELVEKIRNQLEYLFSDENISKDKFLLKHVLKNRDGYVSLRLLLSMKKVRQLSKDWRVVANSLKNSKDLELYEDMTKVRRVHPIPDHLANSCFMVPEIPYKVQTSGDFKNPQKFDEATYASVITSSTGFLRSSMKPHSCNYKNIPSPLSAVAKLSSLKDSRYVSTAGKDSEGVPLMGRGGVNKMDTSLSPSLRRSSSKLDLQWSHSNSDNSRWTDDSCDSSPSPTYDGYRNSGSRSSRWDRNYHNTNSNDPEDYLPMLSCRYKSDSAICASWKQRRQKSAGYDNKKVVIVIRQPRGPDGTIGFHGGRSRMNLKSLKMSDFEF